MGLLNKEKGKMINNYCRGSEKSINRRRVYINIYMYIYIYVHICTTTKRVEAGQGDEADWQWVFKTWLEKIFDWLLGKKILSTCVLTFLHIS